MCGSKAKPKALATKATVGASDAPAQDEAPAGAPSKASALQPAYVIKCSRKTTMVDYDDASFDDCNAQEVDEHNDDINRTAVEGDGVWLFDQGNKKQHGSRERRTAGLHRTPGTLRTFTSLQEANRYAALVVKDLQANHPFEEEASPEEVRKFGSAGTGKHSSSSSDSGKKRKAGAGDGAGEGQTDGSCASLEKQQLYVVDPWGADVRNIASSVVKVEVVKAALSSAAPKQKVVRVARRSFTAVP